jgi:hypothetical protein
MESSKPNKNGARPKSHSAKKRVAVARRALLRSSDGFSKPSEDAAS